MNQTGWNFPTNSQFIQVKILLLKMVAGWNPFFYLILFNFKGTNITSSTFPIQPDFSQNQPAAITLNTGSPWTLVQNPSVSKSNRLHVLIFWGIFMNIGNISQILQNWLVIFLKSWTATGDFLNSNGSFVISSQFFLVSSSWVRLLELHDD